MEQCCRGASDQQRINLSPLNHLVPKSPWKCSQGDNDLYIPTKLDLMKLMPSITSGRNSFVRRAQVRTGNRYLLTIFRFCSGIRKQDAISLFRFSFNFTESSLNWSSPEKVQSCTTKLSTLQFLHYSTYRYMLEAILKGEPCWRALYSKRCPIFSKDLQPKLFLKKSSACYQFTLPAS